MAEWFYRLDDRELGPISESDLKHVFESQALTLSTYVWREGWDDWKKASKVPVFQNSIVAPSSHNHTSPVHTIGARPEHPSSHYMNRVKRRFKFSYSHLLVISGLILIAMLGKSLLSGDSDSERSIRSENEISSEYSKTDIVDPQTATPAARPPPPQPSEYPKTDIVDPQTTTKKTISGEQPNIAEVVEFLNEKIKAEGIAYKDAKLTVEKNGDTELLLVEYGRTLIYQFNFKKLDPSRVYEKKINGTVPYLVFFARDDAPSIRRIISSGGKTVAVDQLRGFEIYGSYGSSSLWCEKVSKALIYLTKWFGGEPQSTPVWKLPSEAVVFVNELNRKFDKEKPTTISIDENAGEMIIKRGGLAFTIADGIFDETVLVPLQHVDLARIQWAKSGEGPTRVQIMMRKGKHAHSTKSYKDKKPSVQTDLDFFTIEALHEHDAEAFATAIAFICKKFGAGEEKKDLF